MALFSCILIASQLLIATIYAYSDEIIANRPNQYKNNTITCNGNGDCKIVCSESKSCYRSTITCPRHFQCDITCNGPNACQLSHVTCPYGDACSIKCSNDNSCRQMTVNAEYSSQFNLNDCSTGDLTCNGMTIYFPPHTSNNPRALINGGDHLTSLKGEITHFYAIYGWYDINIINYNGNFDDNSNGLMHCLPHYQSTCNFHTSSWSCSDETDTCNNPPTQQPTTAPTSAPTFNPTNNPTTDPTNNPTFNPTSSPTKNPSQIPSISPTLAPSMVPTNLPTIEPTTYTPTTDNLPIAFPKNKDETNSQAGILWILTSVLLSILCFIMIILSYYVYHSRHKNGEYTNSISISALRHTLPARQSCDESAYNADNGGAKYLAALQQGSHVRGTNNRYNRALPQPTNTAGAGKPAAESKRTGGNQVNNNINENNDECAMSDKSEGAFLADLDDMKNETYVTKNPLATHNHSHHSHNSMNSRNSKNEKILLQQIVDANLRQSSCPQKQVSPYSNGNLNNLHHQKLHSHSQSLPYWNRELSRSRHKKNNSKPNQPNFQRVNSVSSMGHGNGNSPFSYFTKVDGYGITQPHQHQSFPSLIHQHLTIKQQSDANLMAYSQQQQLNANNNLPPSNIIYQHIQQQQSGSFNKFNLQQKLQQQKETNGNALPEQLKETNDEELEIVIANEDDGIERKDRDVDDITISAMTCTTAQHQHQTKETIDDTPTSSKKHVTTKTKKKKLPKGHPGFIVTNIKTQNQTGKPSKSKKDVNGGSKVLPRKPTKLAQRQSSASNTLNGNTICSPLSTVTASSMARTDEETPDGMNDDIITAGGPSEDTETIITAGGPDVGKHNQSRLPFQVEQFGAIMNSGFNASTMKTEVTMQTEATMGTATTKMSEEEKDTDDGITDTADILSNNDNDDDGNDENDNDRSPTLIDDGITTTQGFDEEMEYGSSGDSHDGDNHDDDGSSGSGSSTCEDSGSEESESDTRQTTIYDDEQDRKDDEPSNDDIQSSASSSASSSDEESETETDDDKDDGDDGQWGMSYDSDSLRSFERKRQLGLMGLAEAVEFVDDPLHHNRYATMVINNNLSSISKLSSDNNGNNYANMQQVFNKMNIKIDDGNLPYESPYDDGLVDYEKKMGNMLSGLFGKGGSGGGHVKSPIDLDDDDDEDDENVQNMLHAANRTEGSTLEIQGLINV